MIYKPSRYNRMVQLNQETQLLFNGMSCALVALNLEYQKQVGALLKNRIDTTDLTDEENQLVHQLVSGKYLVEDTIDELKLIDIQSKYLKYAGRELNLYILPTLNCNFYCTYCYESCTSQVKHAPMSTDTENQVYDFLRDQLTKYRFETVNICWYGGEPLLEYNQLIRMMATINEVCQTHLSKVKHTMVSNGYLMSESKALELKSLGLNRIQLTLDGTKEVHDQRRMLKNKEGTYDHTLQVLKEIAPIIKVVVRINVDKNNTDNALQLLKVFETEGLKPYIGFEFGALISLEFGCSAISGSCFSEEEFANVKLELYKEAVDSGYKVNYFPMHPTSGCTAENMHSYVIEPSGDVKRCYAHVGNPKFSIGHISQPKDFMTKSLNWLTREPTKEAKCEKCDVLPICMGGCYAIALEQGENVNCNIWKYNLNDAIIFNYEQKQRVLANHREKAKLEANKDDILCL